MNNNCERCYVCEKGVANFVTREMFEEAKKKGELHPEWIDVKTDNCIECFACQKCYTAQNAESNCSACFTCQKCYTTQADESNCAECFSCQKCYVGMKSDQEVVTSK